MDKKSIGTGPGGAVLGGAFTDPGMLEIQLGAYRERLRTLDLSMATDRQLRAKLLEVIAATQHAISVAATAGVAGATPTPITANRARPATTGRPLSAATRRKVSIAQKARWANRRAAAAGGGGGGNRRTAKTTVGGQGAITTGAAG